MFRSVGVIGRRFVSNGVRSNVVVNTASLQVNERNERIVSDLSKFYPSMSILESKGTISIKKFIELYHDLPDAGLPNISLRINGRIKNIRMAGKKMCFIDIVNSETNEQLQAIVNYNKLGEKPDSMEFTDSVGMLRRNDYIQIVGYPGFSENKQRTLSLKCLEVPQLLSPIQLPLPNNLTNNTKINKNRVLDYQVNGIDTLIMRSKITKLIRQFYNENNFMEVETPILSTKSNGANAMPFITKLNHDNSLLELRVAPELWLKRLVISGMNKIFELAKVFRNEGIDSTHNPEFTMLECYQTYLSMEDLISMSENLFKYILTGLRNENTEKYGTFNELYDILSKNDWKFKRVEFIPTLSKELNVDFNKIDLSNIKSLMEAIPTSMKLHLFSSDELDYPNHHLSPQRILDKLCGKYIEPIYCQSLHPTIILHHPVAMSPLSKANSEDDKISQRFEVFIRGQEYINAYEEENCPQLQLLKFEAQQDYKDNDGESLGVDYEYVKAMKSAMPPTGGLGLGIDRLCMLLLDQSRIEQVLSFGSLDDVKVQ